MVVQVASEITNKFGNILLVFLLNKNHLEKLIDGSTGNIKAVTSYYLFPTYKQREIIMVLLHPLSVRFSLYHVKYSLISRRKLLED